MGGKGISSNLEIEEIEPPQSPCMYVLDNISSSAIYLHVIVIEVYE